MAKQPPKVLRYAGIEYEAVPLLVRYAGQTYVIAQDPLARDDAAISLPALPPDKGQGRQLGQELGQEQAGPLQGGERDPDIPILPTELQLIEEEDVKKALQPLIDAINTEAQAYLQAVGLQTSGDFVVDSIERDGLDLKVPIKAGNFARIPGDADVYFDFMVELPGAEELEEEARGDTVEEGTPKPPGSWWKGEHLMMDKLAYGVVNVLRGLGEKLKGKKALQEVAVSLCGSFMISPSKSAESLLQSAAFLQKVPKVEPGDLISVPEGEPGSEDSLAWFASFLTRIRKEEYQRTIRERFPQAQWLKPGIMREITTVLVEGRKITQENADTVAAIIDSFANDGEYAQFVADVLEGKPGGGARASREAVERAVRQIVAHEKYKDSAPVHIGTDPSSGDIVARVENPSMSLVFRKGAGGSATPQLMWAEVELCGFKWKVTSAQDAARLFTAKADIVEYKENAIDPSLNQEQKKLKPGDLIRELHKQLQPEATPQTTAPDAPTAKEVFPGTSAPTPGGEQTVTPAPTYG